jgi:hypothetical protein
MNRTFKTYIYNNTVAWKALAADATMAEKSVGLSPHFNRRHITFRTKTEIEHLKFLDTREQDVRDRLKKELGIVSSKTAFNDAIEKTDKIRKAYMSESTAKSPFNQEACIFDSSIGEIVLPIPFETALQLTAFAQQGKIIRLNYKPDEVTLSITIEEPDFNKVEGLQRATRQKIVIK